MMFKRHFHYADCPFFFKKRQAGTKGENFIEAQFHQLSLKPQKFSIQKFFTGGGVPMDGR